MAQYAPQAQVPSEDVVPKHRLAEAEESGYRDPIFAILFILHLAGFIIITIAYGGNFSTSTKDSSGSSLGKDSNHIYGILIVSAIIGAAFSAVWLGVIQRYAATIIKVALIVETVLLVVAAIIQFAAGAVVMGVIMLVIAGLSALYFYYVRDRIPFTSAIMNSAVQALKDHSGPIYLAYVLCVVQIAWFALWIFTMVSVAIELNKNNSGMGSLMIFLACLSLYWTSQVIQNVGHVTTAGTVATWWFVPDSPSPTRGALKRAVTTSFGSICLGSLVVAILRALRAVIRSQMDNEYLACFLNCILACIEGIIEFFNFYAYIQIAMYGKSFTQAAKDTWSLLRARGFDALINQDLSSAVLLIGCLLGGAVAAVVAGIWASSISLDNWAGWAFAAFIIGFLMTQLTMIVVESAVATVFVCWAEDPNTMAISRPANYNQIATAAQMMGARI